MKKPRFTAVPNEVIDSHMKELSGPEFKVLMVVLRSTYGWHKDTSVVSLAKMASVTGLAKSTCVDAVTKLCELGLIRKTANTSTDGGTSTNSYEPIFEDPTPVAPATPLSDLQTTPVGNPDTPPVAAADTHKEERKSTLNTTSEEQTNSSLTADDDTPGEWPEVRRAWETRITKLKASERRLFETRVAEVEMPLDEWIEHIEGYRDSQWGITNNHPIRGFLKDPQSWVSRTVAVAVLGVSPIRQKVMDRPCTQRYFFAFAQNRRELVDSDMEAAWPVLEALTDQQVEASTAHAERNFPQWTNVPSPVKHLAKKPWDTLWVRDANPLPAARKLSKSEQANAEARRLLGIERK